MRHLASMSLTATRTIYSGNRLWIRACSLWIRALPCGASQRIVDIIAIFFSRFLVIFFSFSILPTSSTIRTSFITSFGTRAPDDNTNKCDLSDVTWFKYSLNASRVSKTGSSLFRMAILDNSWWVVGDSLDSPHISGVTLWYFAHSDEERLWYAK